jgi:hypothetical protein
MFRRTVLPLLAAAAVLGVTATPAAAAADPVGPKQAYFGLVNGRTGTSAIRVACLSTSPVGGIGRALPGQTVGAQRVWTVPTQPGYTGSAAREIIAFFSPSASNAASVSITDFTVAVAIPTTILLPCSGTGDVTFTARPTSPTARDTRVKVIFTT